MHACYCFECHHVIPELPPQEQSTITTKALIHRIALTSSELAVSTRSRTDRTQIDNMPKRIHSLSAEAVSHLSPYTRNA
jgi:hypothetical protein